MSSAVFVKQLSRIVRYKGEFSSLASFRASLSFPEDEEEAKTEGKGTLTQEADGFSLSFKETGEEGLSVSLSYAEKEKTLSIKRGPTKMAFALGKETSFLHHLPFGALSASVFTGRLDCQTKGKARLLTLEYELCIGQMAQKNRILFHITPQ